MDVPILAQKIEDAITQGKRLAEDKGGEPKQGNAYYQYSRGLIDNLANKYELDIIVYVITILKLFPDRINDLLDFRMGASRTTGRYKVPRPWFDLKLLRDLLAENYNNVLEEIIEEDKMITDILRVFARMVSEDVNEEKNYDSITDRKQLLVIIRDNIDGDINKHYPTLTKKKTRKYKGRGKHYGEKTTAKIVKLLEQGVKKSAISQKLKISRPTIDRLLKEIELQQK